MNPHEYRFSYQVFSSIEELEEQDALLLGEARRITRTAYAPYSNFQVGAVALLENGEQITGTNQENASYPVGICAERTLLAAAGTRFPGMPILRLAVSYQTNNRELYDPITPCGMCRQAFQEFEERTGQPVRLILGGINGQVIVILKASDLLPLAFTRKELKK